MTNATTTWTPEQIKDLLERSDRMVYRSLCKLAERQTLDEQDSETASHLNKRGFSGADARILTSIWKRSLRYGSLTERQTALVRRRIMKYSRQLAEEANARLDKAG